MQQKQNQKLNPLHQDQGEYTNPLSHWQFQRKGPS